jgi:hypothetical protein
VFLLKCSLPTINGLTLSKHYRQVKRASERSGVKSILLINVRGPPFSLQRTAPDPENAPHLETEFRLFLGLFLYLFDNSVCEFVGVF